MHAGSIQCAEVDGVLAQCLHGIDTDGRMQVTLEGIEADAAELSLFHDEDGDYKLKMGDRGPAEGYATRKCKLPAEHNTATLKLYYPATENE